MILIYKTMAMRYSGFSRIHPILFAMTTPDSACSCIVLAATGAGKVTTCAGCGTVHVSMPQMSLRLTRATFQDLAALVGPAALAIDGAPSPSAGPSLADDAGRIPDRALH